MLSHIISRLVVLVFGTLYPAYASYKAVKTRNVKEYVKWMMYWIVFALFTCVETIADIFASILPFYYEAKILFIFWLISPWTKGATYLYRKFVHPTLTKREQEIDEYLAQASDKGLNAIKKVGQNGLTIAANAVMQSAMKGCKVIKHWSVPKEGQSTLIDQLRNYSTYYNTSAVKQLEGVPEEAAEEVEAAREAKEHMALLRSEDTTDTEEDEDSPHYRNKQLMQSLESLDNRLREDQDEIDVDNDLSYKEAIYERERQERLEREQMEWEQEEQERIDRQERYKNRRLLQSTHDLPPQPPRHRRVNSSKRERNHTTSLTREEFDNANNMYAPDDEVTFKRASSSSSLRRPYSSTENLSRKPARKHEHNSSEEKDSDIDIPNVWSSDSSLSSDKDPDNEVLVATDPLQLDEDKEPDNEVLVATDPLQLDEDKEPASMEKSKEAGSSFIHSFFSGFLKPSEPSGVDQDKDESITLKENKEKESQEKEASEKEASDKEASEKEKDNSKESKETAASKSSKEKNDTKKKKETNTSIKSKESGIPRQKKNTENPKRKKTVTKEVNISIIEGLE